MWLNNVPVADPREGPPYFEKKFVLRPPPPPPSYLRVWIRHCVRIIMGCSRTREEVCVHCVSLITSMLSCWVAQYSETRPLHRIQYHQTDVLQPTLTLKMTTAQVVQTLQQPYSGLRSPRRSCSTFQRSQYSFNCKLTALARCLLF